MRDVFIAGTGMTAFGKFMDSTVRSLAEEAVADALRDAHAAPGDIEMAFFSNATAGILTGQEMIRGQVALRNTGVLGVPIVNVENACASASSAFFLAHMAVASGQVDIALAIGSEKLTHPDKMRSFAAIGTAVDLDNLAAAREALSRTLRLRELLADERLRGLAGSVDGLPSLPRIYGDLTAALESPSCGATEIAAVVCRDPALAAKILQLVNSSFFGLPRQVTSVPEAVAYLGVATVRSLVLSTEAMSLFRPAARAVGLDVDALSSRAVATATEAARLAAAEYRSDARIFAGTAIVDIPAEPVHAKNGDLRILHTRKIPLLDDNGEPAFLLAISEEITERKIAEDERQKVALWVAASKSVLSNPGTDLTLPNLIRNGQQSIPIIETNEQDSIIDYINLDSARAARDKGWVYSQMSSFRAENRALEVKLSDTPYIANRYYYGHTALLDEVRYYPLVQLFIVALFIVITIIAITIRNKSTQN